MVFAIASLLVALVSASPADVKGKWDGTLTSPREDGGTKEDTALLILDQKDKTVTGTVGGSAEHQFPISSGTIEGNKLILTAKDENGREFHLELTIDNDELKGTVASGEMRGQILAHKRKE
ncbi:MAG: hypothetical protein ABI818_05675 [Acidobacteriota bacterium]